MDDPFGVRHVQRIRYLYPQLQNLFQRQRLSVDVLSQRLPINKLHRDKRSVVVFPNVINSADARMRQCRGSMRLTPESFQRLLILHHVVR